MTLVVTSPPANAGDLRDMGSIPGSERSPGGGHGNPLKYSFLGNLIDRGAWWAMVHRVAKSQTQLKQLSMHTHNLGPRSLCVCPRETLCHHSLNDQSCDSFPVSAGSSSGPRFLSPSVSFQHHGQYGAT